MKILLINKFYYEKGGAERYFFSLKRLLEEAGHEVIPFSMAHSENVHSSFSEYFVSNVDLSRPSFSWQSLKAAGRLFYSFEAARKLKALIAEVRPDVAHVHNIYHQLSPSVLKVLRSSQVPIVQTLHDYAYLSPVYGLFAKHRIYEDTKPRKYFRVVRDRAIKNSFFASLLDAAAYTFHALRGLDERMAQRLIAPSQFVKEKFIDWDRTKTRIDVVPHFVEVDPEVSFAPGKHAIFVGRLSEEKGIGVLIAAYEKMPNERLVVVGTGPMESELKTYVGENKMRNVTFLGALSHDEALARIRQSRFVVVPSLTYETFGYTVAEAFAMGKTVVSSNIGGLSELVAHGRNGLLVPPGNADALVSAIRSLSPDIQLIEHMAQAGHQMVKEKLDPERHLEKITEIYRAVI